MSEFPRGDEDKAFARNLTKEFQGRFIEVEHAQRADLGAKRGEATLLEALERQVGRYIVQQYNFSPTPYAGMCRKRAAKALSDMSLATAIATY
jgi:hypothetical protein